MEHLESTKQPEQSPIDVMRRKARETFSKTNSFETLNDRAKRELVEAFAKEVYQYHLQEGVDVEHYIKEGKTDALFDIEIPRIAEITIFHKNKVLSALNEK